MEGRSVEIIKGFDTSLLEEQHVHEPSTLSPELNTRAPATHPSIGSLKRFMMSNSKGIYQNFRQLWKNKLPDI